MDEPDPFVQAIFKWDVAQRFVSPSTISQARHKLSHRVFIELLDNIRRFINKYTSLKTPIRQGSCRGLWKKEKGQRRGNIFLGLYRNDGKKILYPDGPSIYAVTDLNDISARTLFRWKTLYLEV